MRDTFPSEHALLLQTPEQTHQPDGFAVLRLILVDSLSPGRIVELPVDGGAVLTGRNGRGKTSLLQLLLLFYGESPNRIVTAEAGRQNFIGYYLPRITSYIAFEYQRLGGHKRMIVAYADRNGDRVLYRFVRHSFDITQFVLADGNFVHAQNFVKHLRLHGFECAERQIESQVDYRSVIQGVPNHTTDKQHQRYLRELAQEYSFTTTKQPLRQIEKIVSGMFRRKTNFDDLQSMVIDCVSDEVAAHSISGDRRKIEDWPKGYKAYTSVMALAPKMETAQNAENQLQAVELAIGEVRAKYLSLVAYLDQETHRQRQEQRRQEALLEDKKSQYQQQQSKLTGQRLTAEHQAAFAEQKAQELQDHYNAYEQAGIRELDKRVRNGQNLRNELLNLEERRKALLGAQSEISACYERLKLTEKESFNMFRDTAQQNLRQVAEVCERELHELENSFETAEQLAVQTMQSKREVLEQAVQDTSTEHGRCLHAIEHPAIDPKSIELLERKQKMLETVRRTKDAVDGQRRVLDATYRKAMQAFLDQERQVSAAMRLVDAAEKELADKRRQLTPQEGTLLYFLRTEHPQWSYDIAKVIRDDLLERTDLAPALVESSVGLYGLSLALERLESHPAADVDAAAQEVMLAESRLKDARAAVESARNVLAQHGAARESAEHNCQTHEQQAQKVEAQVRAAVAEVEEAKRQIEANRREAVALAKQHVELAQQALQEAKKSISRFDEEARVETAQRRSVYAQKRRDRQQKRDTETSLIDASVTERKVALDAILSQYDAERDDVLRQKGVDTVKLQGIDNEMSRINTEISAIKTFIKRVQEWNYWKDNQWPAHDGYLAEGVKARKAEQQYATEIAELDANWHQCQQRSQALIKQIGGDLARLDEQRELAKKRIDGMHDYPEVAVPEYDPSWTLDALAGLANQHIQHASRLNSEMRKSIAEVAFGFRMHQGTPPEQYLQLTLGPLSPTPSRDWIAPFKLWFAKEHQEYQRILLMEAVNIAGEVKAFHRTMDEFHRRVQQFNRELQEHLDTSLAFESISKVSVEVVSTITELKYWPAICEMAEAHRAWLGGASNDLPPPEFAQNIERLLEHWEVKTGIRADLKSLIRIQGEVTENGHRRVFKRASDLEAVSSNGLSYLVLATIFVAFINRIRRDANVNITWALDELKDLDAGNVVSLVELLERNNITLVSAFPDPDPDTLALFKHRFTVEPDRRLASVRVALVDENEASFNENEELEVSHV